MAPMISFDETSRISPPFEIYELILAYLPSIAQLIRHIKYDSFNL